MEIWIKDNKLQAALRDDALCKKRFGVEMAKKIKMRLEVLRAAESLGTFWPPKSKPERCHELVGDLAGHFSMDVKQPYRLLFKPIETSEHEYADEHQRWQNIRSIEVLGIEDTHG